MGPTGEIGIVGPTGKFKAVGPVVVKNINYFLMWKIQLSGNHRAYGNLNFRYRADNVL